MKSIVLLFLAFTIAGCTSVDVRPVTASLQMKHVLIRDNPKVIVEGFLNILRDGFDRHGISSEVIAPDAEVVGQYVVTYTALRSWDIVPYLTYAEIRIEKNGRQVAYAEYHLRGKGGLSPAKWQGAKTKIDPVMDQLLGSLSDGSAKGNEANKAPEPTPVPVTPAAGAPVAPATGAAQL
jgi:hypothetical protein